MLQRHVAQHKEEAGERHHGVHAACRLAASLLRRRGRSGCSSGLVGSRLLSLCVLALSRGALGIIGIHGVGPLLLLLSGCSFSALAASRGILLLLLSSARLAGESCARQALEHRGRQVLGRGVQGVQRRQGRLGS